MFRNNEENGMGAVNYSKEEGARDAKKGEHTVECFPGYEKEF